MTDLERELLAALKGAVALEAKQYESSPHTEIAEPAWLIAARDAIARAEGNPSPALIRAAKAQWAREAKEREGK